MDSNRFRQHIAKNQSPVYFGKISETSYAKIVITADLEELAKKHKAPYEAIFNGKLLRLLNGIDIREDLNEIVLNRLENER